MFDTRCQFAAPTLFLDPSLLCFSPEPIFRFRGSEHRKADGDVTGHILQSLDLGVAEAPARRRAPKNIHLLEFKGELAGRMMVPFRKTRPVEEKYPSGVGAVSGVFGLPVPRHKIVDAIDFVLRQALEDPCEPCLGVDVVQLAGFHERIGDCSRFSAAD